MYVHMKYSKSVGVLRAGRLVKAVFVWVRSAFRPSPQPPCLGAVVADHS